MYKKNPGGRPPKWNNPDELENLIEAYFISLQNPDKPNEYIKPPTITGLALALGTTRNTLVDYEQLIEKEYSSEEDLEKAEKFLRTIKKAKARCEQWVEENAMLNRANATFSIFNLKNNYGWKDKTEQDISVKELPKPIMDITNNNVRPDDSHQENNSSN